MGISKIKKGNKLKEEKQQKDQIKNVYQLKLFSGVGDIKKEHSSIKDVVNYFGFPNTDSTDERENRMLEYHNHGLYFKFLNDFSIENNSILSYIIVKSPFKCQYENAIKPGMRRNEVHKLMKKYDLKEEKDFFEVWLDRNHEPVKLKYNKRQRLESIIIY